MTISARIAHLIRDYYNELCIKWHIWMISRVHTTECMKAHAAAAARHVRARSQRQINKMEARMKL